MGNWRGHRLVPTECPEETREITVEDQTYQEFYLLREGRKVGGILRKIEPTIAKPRNWRGNNYFGVVIRASCHRVFFSVSNTVILLMKIFRFYLYSL